MSEPQIDRKILLVDDEEACLVAVKLMLEGAGYKVEAVNSGIKALEMLKNEPENYSLILLDMMMPDINGIDFLKKLSKFSDLKRIPVIIQTGISESKELEQALQIGAISCVRKPYSFEAINSHIEKLFVKA